MKRIGSFIFKVCVSPKTTKLYLWGRSGNRPYIIQCETSSYVKL